MTTVPEQIAALERKIGPRATSPLFAQLAALYLEAGRTRDALRVCDSGLAHHPYYSTGHLIKGKALSALNMRAEARREFEYVLELLPGAPAVLELLKNLPPAIEEEPALPPEEARRETVEVASPPPAEIPAAVSEPEPELAPEPEPEPSPEPTSSVEEQGRLGEETTARVIGFGEPEYPEPPEEEPQPQERHQEPVTAAEEESAGEDAFGAPRGFEPEPVVEQPPVDAAPVHVEEAAEPETATSPEDVFGFGTETGEEKPPTVVEAPVLSEVPEAAGVGSFDVPPDTASFLVGIPDAIPATEQVAEPAPIPPGPDYGFSGSDLLFSGPADEDTFEKYSLRMRAEMSGEGTLTLEDFFNNVEPVKAEGPAEPEPTLVQTKDRIEELAERLQGARKITPVINLAQKTASAPSEQDTPASTGFVTPTLAEIYAKQGWYDDAIKAYRTLATTKPAERERFERRIKELEDLKRKNMGL